MKKYISIILALALAFCVSACGKKTEQTVNDDKQQIEQEAEVQDEILEEKNEETEKEESQKEEKPGKNDAQTSQKPEEKPAVKPEEEKTEEDKKEDVPAENKTVANTLLSQFNSIATDSGSAVSIAQKLVENPIIAFSGGAMEIEPGYLSGFGNTEIKGFKEGAMFAPMIGTIPFIGYVFTLEEGADAAAFVSNLKANADLRWNICTSADEMVGASKGNKVFFVMSPLSFEEQ